MTFGGKAPVAETFAVGRIAAIYALFGSFIIAVVAPRLAGIRDDAHFVRMAVYFLVCVVVLCAAMIIFAYLVPSVLLLLIGERYAHLHREVVLSVAGASFGLLTSFLVIANRLRGWVRLEPAVAMCQVIAIMVLAPQWSFQDSSSVLSLMVTLSGVSLLCFFMTSVVGVLVPSFVKLK
jgi:hypothetical protein